jgi:hypothetical protein
MYTVMLRSNARKSASGNSFTIEVLGESAIKDDIKASISALEHHPARASRRTIIDMLSIIEKHRLQIRFAEREEDADGLETWTFILQS